MFRPDFRQTGRRAVRGVMPVSRNRSGDVPSDLRNAFAGCFYGAGAGGFVCRQRLHGMFLRRGCRRFCLPATLLREVFLREAARIPFFLPVFYRRIRKVFVRGAFSVNFCAFFRAFFFAGAPSSCKNAAGVLYCNRKQKPPDTCGVRRARHIFCRLADCRIRRKGRFRFF